MNDFTLDDVQREMAAHIPLYARHLPVYQYAALKSLDRVWSNSHRSMLDVGGGTGIMAQTIKSLFHLGRVVSVDIEDRFLHSLDIETKLFNGQSLPFDDGSFDCIMLFNVLHHVLPGQRALLLRECRRVVGQGPIYIKDHLSHGIIDNARLAALDLMGNLPFKGMLSARYLRAAEWEKLAACSKSVAAPFGLSQYRSGLFQIIFPNRLEVVTRWSNEAASRA